MKHRTPTALATALLVLGCGGRVIIDQGEGGNTGEPGSGGQSASSSSASSTGSGTTPGCTGIPNDCCATAIDATQGGGFEGTTCGADTTFTTTGQCGAVGAPDAFYLVNPPGGFYAYQIDVSPDFYIMATADPKGCNAPSTCPFDGSSGVLYGETPLYVAVQHQGGACGPFKISFQLLKQ